jgi:hypothetical protein
MLPGIQPVYLYIYIFIWLVFARCFRRRGKRPHAEFDCLAPLGLKASSFVLGAEANDDCSRIQCAI